MTTDIETIKATVRSRLTTRLAPPANPIGAPFDHGDYIIEELAGDLIGFTRVNAFYDPTIGLPQDPSELDRYIATATANGWTKNNIYTYLDGDWYETAFEPGLTFAYVIAEDNYYGAYPTGWQELSIGGIDDYVTLTTDQNVTGKKTFSQKIGQGTTDPQSMIHINLPYEDWMGGIQISKGFADESDGVTINLAGADALYGVSYTGRHIFNIETRPGGWETGLVIEDTPVNGPVLSTPQIVVGEPIGSDMGIGSLNAEALYVNGEPVITGTFDIDDYVTLTTDQNISGQKTFSQGIGIGTNNPQRLLHLNTDDSSHIGIGLGRYGDVDNYLTIDLDGNNATYNIGYSGSHVFEVETAPGTSEIGLWISGQYHKGPTVQAYQLVAGNPYGWGMGVGSINAEALYVEGEPVVTGTFDIDDYVTIATDQNITGQKTFDQAIGVGTTNPQNMLHINGSGSPGLQISNGFSDGDDGLSINLEGSLAVYKVSYTGSHIFGIETSPGVWETGLVIGDTPVNGPVATAPQIVVGEPIGSDTGGSMGPGTLNAEALYVNGEPVVTGTFDIDDYVTLTTDQNISGQKTFSQGIGIGTDNPQRLLHLNTDDSSHIGIGLGRYGGVDNYLTIDLDGNNATYNIGYSGSHVFEVETSPGTSEIGLWISGQHGGPTVQAYQLVAGNPYGWGMGVGSINAEALYVEGEPVVTGTFDSSDYYTKTNLQTSGQSQVHANNITNVPWLTSLPSHNHDTRYYTYNQLQISGQSQVHANNITNAPWLTSLPSHNHDTRYDTRYYTRTNLKTSGQASVHWGNVTDKPTEFPSKYHVHDTDDLHSGVLPVERGGTGFSNGYGYVVAHGFNNPMDTISLIPWNHIDGKPTAFSPEDHNHSATDINSGTLSNSRLSFNPDYLVQGENSSRAITYSISNPFDGANNVSTFFRLDNDEPSNPDGLEYYYGFRCVNPNHDGYTTEIAGRANAGKLWFGGLIGDVRQPWREIHHSGVNYIKYDNNPAEVSHPTASEDLGTSNHTLNPTKGIYYAQGRSDTQTITMGAPQFFGQVVEIVHNGLESLRVFCGPFNPPMIVNVPKYSILRLRAISTPQYIGWSPVT